MFRRRLSLILVAGLLASLAGCGGSDDGSPTGASTEATAALLNRWSDTTLAALAALQAQSKAATARDQKAFDEASKQAQEQLKLVVGFPDDAKEAIGSSSNTAVAKAVTADAAAWKAWAALLREKKLTQKELLQVGELGGTAAQAHVDAYRAAGIKVPPAFQRQAGGGNSSSRQGGSNGTGGSAQPSQ